MAASPTEMTLAEMMEDARIAGRLVGAAIRPEVASRTVHLVAEGTVPVTTDRAADGQIRMEMGTTEDTALAAVAVPVAEGAQGAPEAEDHLAAREEEEVPLMKVMTMGEEMTASAPTSRKS